MAEKLASSKSRFSSFFLLLEIVKLVKQVSDPNVISLLIGIIFDFVEIK